ncbi:MAG: hypothetical protein ABSG82_07640 [Sedimentisphaerales bacterium]|jgi:Fe-S-cluster containining protein
MKANKEIIRQVGRIYDWLDEQLIIAQNTLAGVCDVSRKGHQTACGKCCDFQMYDHRLYVTTPEMLFFIDKLGVENIKEMAGGRCPYQMNTKCTVHPYRFAGCRIFCCKADPAFQSVLTEAVIKKFKTICDEFQIPYRYVDLPTALKDFLTTG